jgi:Flp pilus assembly pilin Flp
MILLRAHTAVLTLALAASARLSEGLRRFRDDEEGLTTTEIAVITFLLVGGAIVIGGIIYAAGRGAAESIPVPDAPAR